MFSSFTNRATLRKNPFSQISPIFFNAGIKFLWIMRLSCTVTVPTYISELKQCYRWPHLRSLKHKTCSTICCRASIPAGAHTVTQHLCRNNWIHSFNQMSLIFNPLNHYPFQMFAIWIIYVAERRRSFYLNACRWRSQGLLSLPQCPQKMSSTLFWNSKT